MKKYLLEILIIALITSLCGVIIQFITKFAYKDEEKYKEIFSWYNNLIFYVLLFLIGILIHKFMSYIDIYSWVCESSKVGDIQNIDCIMPYNAITKILV